MVAIANGGVNGPEKAQVSPPVEVDHEEEDEVEEEGVAHPAVAGEYHLIICPTLEPDIHSCC